MRDKTEKRAGTYYRGMLVVAGRGPGRSSFVHFVQDGFFGPAVLVSQRFVFFLFQFRFVSGFTLYMDVYLSGCMYVWMDGWMTFIDIYPYHIAAKAKLQHKVHKARNLLTKSNWFQGKVKEVWEACDANGTGSLNKDELYTGIIFLHLKLAEKAGAAACHVSGVPFRLLSPLLCTGHGGWMLYSIDYVLSI